MAQDSYLIWPGGGNDPALGYGSLELRRRIAQQLAAGKRPFPKTKGEGLTYLGESIGEGMQYIGLQRAEKERQAKLEKQAKELVPDAKTDTSTSTTSDKTSYNQQDSKPFPPAASDTAYNIDRPTQVVAAPAETPAVSGLPPDLSGVPAMQTTAEWPTVPSFNDRFAAVSTPPPDATPGQAASISSPEVQNMFFSPQMQASLSGGGGATAADVMPVAQAAAPAQVTLPTETRDIPLPMGNPRTTGGVRATMEAVASRGGMTPNAVAGLERNVRDESNFNYNLRHPDQPGFSGEARFAHGLYQEGGDEWNNFVKWIDQNHPGSDWRDPKLQTQYTVERLQDPSRPDYNRTFAGMNAAPNSGVAADQFLRGYLKPAEQYREARSASYLRDGGDPAYASRDVQPGGGGGTQVAGTRIAPGDERMGGAPVDQRDAIAAALMQQPQVQQQPTQEEAAAEGRLADVAGARRPGSPIFPPTAALGRAGVATDAPAAGLSPMGSLGSTGIDQSIEARRNAITDALQNQQPTAPAVPQPDPTQSGTTSPTTASPWTSAATSALPSPTVVSDIRPAPVTAGQVVAQARPTQPSVAEEPGISPRPEPVRPRPPERLPRDDQERAAIRMKLSNPGDPDAAMIADTILKDKEQKRNDIFARDVEQYKSDMARYNTEYSKWLDDKTGGFAKRRQDYTKSGQDIIAGQPGGGQVTPTGAAPQIDPRLGTTQSPQRTSIPSIPPVPAGVTPSKWAELHAPIATKAIEAVQTAEPAFNDAIKMIQLARNHPGREFGVGFTANLAKQIPGTDAYGFNTIMEQIGGKNFLQAYQQLKGGGSITEIEGTKAEAAQARLKTAQSKEDWDKAMNDFEIALRRDLELAQRKVNAPVTAWRAAGDNKSYAPDIGERRGDKEYIGGNPRDPMSWRKVQQ